MGEPKRARRKGPAAAETTGDPVEQKVIAFAEQLGRLIGTVQVKAEGWLEPARLTQELGRIRDGAADLLNDVTRRAALRSHAAVKKSSTRTARPSRGPVDAPGKRHRKRPAQQRIDKRLGEPRGKHAGQKSLKSGRRGG